jgi:hypothetical protein
MQTLLGLIRETWGRLEEDHDLEEKFGISPVQLMAEVEGQLRHQSRGRER